MRVSLILGASVVALSLVMTNGVLAKTHHHAKSTSTVTTLDAKDPNAEKACTDGGGKVSTNKHGKKICTTPKEKAAKSTTTSSSESTSTTEKTAESESSDQ